MSIELLKDQNGDTVYVTKGASADLVFTFKDTSGSPLDKASIVTLTATLVNPADGSPINGRDDQSVLDVNGGAVDVNGVLTLKIGPADTSGCRSVVAGGEGFLVITLRWSWVDGDLDTRWGVKPYRFYVREVPR